MGNHILRLGTYCPMLNPIESAWSGFKAEVKRSLAEYDRYAMICCGCGSRKSSLYRISSKNFIRCDFSSISIPVITPSLCNNVIARIQSLIPSVLNVEDMTY